MAGFRLVQITSRCTGSQLLIRGVVELTTSMKSQSRHSGIDRRPRSVLESAQCDHWTVDGVAGSYQDMKKGSAASARLSNDINYLQLISFGDIFKIVKFKFYKARILHIRARVRVAHALVYVIKSSLNFRKTKSFLNQI